MMIGYGRPADISASLNGGDAAFVDGGSYLFDGRPGSVSAFTWRTGAQTTATTVNLDTLWASAIVPRVVGINGTTLPAGTLITITGKRSGDSGYPYALGTPSTVRVVQKARGERVAWIVLPEGLTACIGLRFAIANDVNGVVGITAGAEHRLGECWVGSGVVLSITPDWTDEPDNVVGPSESDAFQPYAQRKTPRRLLRFTPSMRSEKAIYGDGVSSDMTFQELWAKLDRNQQAVYIPRYKDAAGTYSAHLVNQTACFGTADKAPASKHLRGPWFGPGEMQVREAPFPT